MLSIYERAKAAKLEMDHHEADLYPKDTQTARQITKNWESDTGHSASATTFCSDDDKTRWIDVPFAYDPFWTRAVAR